MPKSKNRRKKGKISPAYIEKSQETTRGKTEASTASHPTPKNFPVKKSFKERLYEDSGEGLFQLLSYFPLFLGAWTFGGLALNAPLPFVLVSVPVLILHVLRQIKHKPEVLFPRELEIISYAGIAAITFYIFSETGSLFLVSFSALSSIIFIVEERLGVTSVPHLLLRSLGLTLRMSLYSLMGILSQQLDFAHQLHFFHAVFGFVPACILVSYLVARYSEVFLAAGWKRSRLGKSRKTGEAVPRPAALSQLFSLPVIVGPVIPLAFVPLAQFPPQFLLLALTFYRSPGLAEAFMKELEPDSQIAIQALHITVIAVAILVVIGFIL